MRVLFATSNPHKLEELRSILRPAGIVVLGLGDLGHDIPEPAEDGATFEENARIKALAYARASGTACIAEDSGLVVDALGGAPGVHSARYAELHGSRVEKDQANNERLLRALEGIPSQRRAARFVCALCFADPAGQVLAETRGTMEGEIVTAPRGSGGFGYDPLLYLPDVGRTSAELTPSEKNARSHRGAAARALLTYLRPEQAGGAG